MVFTDLLFLIGFLPISIIIYYLVPPRFKDCILILISLLFYAISASKYVPFLVLISAFDVLSGRIICKKDLKESLRKIFLFIGITANLLPLIIYKIMSNVDAKRFILPLGLSFFAFKAISYLVDAYKKSDLNGQPITQDLMYLTIFTQIQSGPISRYEEFKEKNITLKNKEIRSRATNGIFRFMIGFSKKILLADMLFKISEEIFEMSVSSLSNAIAWLGAVSYSLALFFDFSGYSDMAIGLTNLFGYKSKENFDYPYTATSASDFWRRWHISLGAWFRDYVYIPLGGSRNKTRSRVYLNLFIVWFLTGLWHGLNLTFIVWGMGYFVLISIEKMTDFPKKNGTILTKGLYRIFLLVFVCCEWVIFYSNNITAAFGYLGKMFVPFPNGISTLRAEILLKDYSVIIIAAILLCTPIFKIVKEKCRKSRITENVYEIIQTLIVLLLFAISVSFVVSGNNNPFTYANF